MFANSSIDKNRKIRSKFLGYLLLAYMLKMAVFLVKFAFGKMEAFSLSDHWGTAWYLFILAFYILFTWSLKGINRRALVIGSIVLALYIGYDNNVSNAWNLSRLFVFYPFFLLGTLWTPDQYHFHTKRYQRMATVVSALLLIITFCIVYIKIDIISNYTNLLWGNLPYKKIFDNFVWGWLMRLGIYVIAIILGICIVTIVPERKCVLTFLGRNSLSIYLTHRIVLHLMVYMGIKTLLQIIWSAHWRFLFVSLSIPVTVFFALPIFRTRIDRYWKWLERWDLD